jgi:hypothetical protein
MGGGIWSVADATLVIDPRAGVSKGSRQARAKDLIIANQANRGLGGEAGPGGSAVGGNGGSPNGAPGNGVQAGAPGASGDPGSGVAGGLGVFPSKNITIASTTITGNSASSGDDNTGGADIS